jgi:hypothetical protein
VPTEGKEYESEADAVPPAIRATDAEVPISVAPVPDASVAFWKRLVKPDPVGAFPMFVMVAEYVVETSTAEEVGETEPAVRSEPVVCGVMQTTPSVVCPT